jgi:predicted nucleotidyltransferase
MAPTGMAATSTCWSMRCPCHVVGLGRFEEELKSLLGVDVDLLTPGDLPPKFRAKVLAEAQPI